MRSVPAFLISPLSAVVLMPLIGFRWRGNTELTNVISSFVFVYLLFLCLQLLFAAPLRWYLARKGWRSVWIDGGVAVIAFVVPDAVYIFGSHGNADVPVPALGLAIGVVLGLVIGLTYGVLRLRDRRASQCPTPTELASRFD
jgi:hypothetical protein